MEQRRRMFSRHGIKMVGLGNGKQGLLTITKSNEMGLSGLLQVPQIAWHERGNETMRSQHPALLKSGDLPHQTIMKPETERIRRGADRFPHARRPKEEERHE
jgi:hypothetical protein